MHSLAESVIWIASNMDCYEFVFVITNCLLRILQDKKCGRSFLIHTQKLAHMLRVVVNLYI